MSEELERWALPNMPRTLEEFFVDLHSHRFQGNDAEYLLSQLMGALEYAIMAFDEVQPQWKVVNSQRSAAMIAEMIRMCQIYYNEGGAQIFLNLCALLGIRYEVRPAAEEYFQLVASREETLENPSLFGKRPVDSVLRRMTQEISSLHSQADNAKPPNILIVLIDDFRDAIGKFMHQLFQ